MDSHKKQAEVPRLPEMMSIFFFFLDDVNFITTPLGSHAKEQHIRTYLKLSVLQL